MQVGHKVGKTMRLCMTAVLHTPSGTSCTKDLSSLDVCRRLQQDAANATQRGCQHVLDIAAMLLR